MAAVSKEYLWIVIVGGIACFCMSFSIGANDVANNFSTSVGSKALSLWLAICLAAILETIGATLLGGAVTDAVRSQIIDFAEFAYNPPILMLGMLCALVGAGCWLFIATRYGLPVSTTHSIIGALLGFGLSSGNVKTIRWKKIGFILLSWIIAPISAAIAGGSIFVTLRKFILRNKNKSFQRSIRFLWLLIFCMSISFSFFLVFKNPFVIQTDCLQAIDPNAQSPVSYQKQPQFLVEFPCVLSKWAAAHSAIASAISIGIAAVLSLFLSIIVYKIAFRRVRKYEKNMKIKQQTNVSLDSLDVSDAVDESAISIPAEKMQSFCCEYSTSTCANHNIGSSTNRSNLSLPMNYNIDKKNNIENECNNSNNNCCVTVCLHPVEKDEEKEKKIDEENQIMFTNINGETNNNKFEGNKNNHLSSSSSDVHSQYKLSIEKFKDSVQEKWRSMPWFKNLVEESCEEDSLVDRIHSDAEVFETKTEIFFSACQVLAACLGCIAHSANDTANAIGPLAAILTIYYKGLNTECNVEWYILLFGGLSMSLGLALLGYRVIKTVGTKLVKITPCRGFSIDLGAAWVVLIFSAFGVPLSTTHCAIGSTLGVGLMEKRKEKQDDDAENNNFKQSSCSYFFSCHRKFRFLNTSSVNWKLFGGIFVSWIGTVVFSATVSMLLFSFAAYSPNIISK